MNACALVVSVLLAMGAVAQTERTVSGSGAEKVKVMPTALRVVVAVQSEGDTVDAAIADVQKKADELAKKLAELKPVEGSLVAEGPYDASASGAEEMGTSELMAPLAMPNVLGAEPGEAGKEKVKLQTTIRAEWALPVGDLAASLREAEKIRQAVKTAAPEAAAKETDEESNEEMRLAMERGYGQAMVPGRPSFLFVGRLSDDALSKARHEAFLKAQKNAQATAEAAGAALGPLVTVTSQVAPAGEEGYEYERYAMRMMGMTEPVAEEEGVSPSLRPLTFTVGVTATFALAAK